MKTDGILAAFFAVFIFLILFSPALFYFKGSDYVQLKIDKANYCETKEDCVDIGGKCPFGCYIYVNNAEAETIKKIVDTYESKCVYNCLVCEDVQCVNNTCQEVCG